MKLLVTVLSLLAATTHAMFRFDCFNNLVVERADPIVSFGQISGHVHMISGGNGFSSSATPDELRRSSCTSCPIGADLSAYWVPQLYVEHKNGSGYSLVDSHQIVYYQQRPMNDTERVLGLPKNLRMVAGDPSLRSPGDSTEQKAVTWQCLDYENPVKEASEIPNVKCPDGLRGQINFPMCWNGVDEDSDDHKSHMAYSETVEGGPCPAGYKKVVKLFYEAFFRVGEWADEWKDDGSHPFVLANGDRTGYSFHGDFLNGWDVDVLQDAVDKCADKNYFDSGECPPLSPSFSDAPSEQRCTVEPEFDEDVDVVNRLPGDNPVDGQGPASTPSHEDEHDESAVDDQVADDVDEIENPSGISMSGESSAVSSDGDENATPATTPTGDAVGDNEVEMPSRDPVSKCVVRERTGRH